MYDFTGSFILGVFNGLILIGILLGHHNNKPTIILKNPKTEAIKEIPVGWSWWLFLAPALYGLPLFFRRLFKMGTLIVFFTVSYSYAEWLRKSGAEWMNDQLSLAVTILSIVFHFSDLALQVWLGKKGNELTAKIYLKKGWVFADPNSSLVAFAKKEWKLA